MRITSKGQVTIPQHIREQAGLQPMTEVEFAFEGGVVTLRPVVVGETPRRNLDPVIARMRGTADVKMTTDEIMALTRGD
jgi:AbrB family looped-hinge helix DNA binding protein